MRLIITPGKEKHTDLCSTVAVSLRGDILTGGDDATLRRWNGNGEALGVVATFPSCITQVVWVPALGGGGGGGLGASRAPLRGAAAGVAESAVRDNCVVALANGSYAFVNVAHTRIERTVEAHEGCITALVYTADGTSILTAGEDGLVKVWSQAGMMRSTLASTGRCIYALCVGYESVVLGGDCVLYTSGPDVVIHPLRASVKKQIQWTAHRDSVVVCADWSRMNRHIITGAEDGRYRVWDEHRRMIYNSAAGEYPVTSVRYVAHGNMFAVGSFEHVRVCDQTGWSHTYERVKDSGNILAMQWMPDGTQLVLGGVTGAVQMAQCVDWRTVWDEYTVTQLDRRRLRVQNMVRNSSDTLEQREAVTQVGVGYGYVVVCTATTCACYAVDRLQQPTQFDLHDAVVTLMLGPGHFMIADCAQGVQLYTYEGRSVCVCRLAVALRPEMLAQELMSVSPDVVALRNPMDARQILFFDARSGKTLEHATITHSLEVVSVHLSQGQGNGGVSMGNSINNNSSGSSYGPNERAVAFVDRNRELYFAQVQLRPSSSSSSQQGGGPSASSSAVHSSSPHGGSHVYTQKISTIVSSVMWHDTYEILIALADGHLKTWYYPSIVSVDRDLAALTQEVKNTDAGAEFGANDRLLSFHHTRVQVRRGSDGALLTFSVSPYPIQTMQLVEGRSTVDWDGATRLARFMSMDLLWALLVGLAVRRGELDVAEIGYGALGELAKARYMHNMKNIPSAEGRQAELALFQHRSAEAERILLQAGLIYRCIDMHTRLFNWERALAIATERKTHIDTVLGRRQRYLAEVNQPETLPMFKALAGKVTVHWDTVNEKIRMEMAKESEREGVAAQESY